MFVFIETQLTHDPILELSGIVHHLDVMNPADNLPDRAADLTDLLIEALDGADPVRVRYLVALLGQALDSRFELPGLPDTMERVRD